MKERFHSSMRRNYEETSKHNNQQRINNHCTCQCNSVESWHLLGGAVASAWGEAIISLWRRLHFRNCLALPILASVQNNWLEICFCSQSVTSWTTTWPPMAITRWNPDTKGVTTFWSYQRSAVVLSILANFWVVVRKRQEEGI